jgi:hypothetical protein
MAIAGCPPGALPEGARYCLQRDQSDCGCMSSEEAQVSRLTSSKNLGATGGRQLSASQGLMRPIPVSVKSPMLRVASVALYTRQMAAI